jgi:hypothetical protein
MQIHPHIRSILAVFDDKVATIKNSISGPQVTQLLKLLRQFETTFAQAQSSVAGFPLLDVCTIVDVMNNTADISYRRDFCCKDSLRKPSSGFSTHLLSNVTNLSSGRVWLRHGQLLGRNGGRLYRRVLSRT